MAGSPNLMNNAHANISADQPGPVKQGVAVDDSVAADIATMVVDFNALLASLRTAGVIAE